MKRNQIKLNRISKFIDIDMFYTLSISSYSIQMQGRFVPANVVKLNKLGFVFVTNKDSGYLESTRYNITIVFSD